MFIMRKLIFFCVLCCLCIPLFSQKTIAVMDFQSEPGISQAKADKLSAAFNACFCPKGYILMDRSQLAQVIEKQGLDYRTMTETQMLRVGKDLNLTSVVCGEVKSMGSLLSLEVKVLDVKSKKTVWTDKVTFAWKNHKTTMRQFASQYMSAYNEENVPSKTGPETVVKTEQEPKNKQEVKQEAQEQKMTKESEKKKVTVNQKTCKEKTMHDADGNSYNTVLIGRQCWMRENMRSTRGRDGKTLNFYEPNAQVSNVQVYGYLYDWKSASKVCPSGWHLATKGDWDKLEHYMVSSGMACGDGAQKNTAKALAASSGWVANSDTCTVGNDQSMNNETGFTALPAGLYNFEHYSNFGYKAVFWCALDYDSYYAYSCNVSFDSAHLGRFLDTKSSGFSVRCVHD